MTVKDQLMLLKKGYSRDEINAMKEAEKLENEPKDEPKDEPKVEPKEDPKDEPKNEPKDEPKDEPKEDPRDTKIKEMEEEIKRLQSDNVNRDVSGNNTDTRSLFEQGVDIFKGKF